MKAQVPLTPEQFMLIDLMKKDKNSVTQLVDAIERKGFVVRQQNAQDWRSNTIVLTEKLNDNMSGQ